MTEFQNLLVQEANGLATDEERARLAELRTAEKQAAKAVKE